jgi:hypothetical protein
VATQRVMRGVVALVTTKVCYLWLIIGSPDEADIVSQRRPPRQSQNANSASEESLD